MLKYTFLATALTNIFLRCDSSIIPCLCTFIKWPQVVYMDEPSTGLDPASRKSLWDAVKQAKRDRAIVLTSNVQTTYQFWIWYTTYLVFGHNFSSMIELTRFLLFLWHIFCSPFHGRSWSSLWQVVHHGRWQPPVHWDTQRGLIISQTYFIIQ